MGERVAHCIAYYILRTLYWNNGKGKKERDLDLLTLQIIAICKCFDENEYEYERDASTSTMQMSHSHRHTHTHYKVQTITSDRMSKHYTYYIYYVSCRIPHPTTAQGFWMIWSLLESGSDPDLGLDLKSEPLLYIYM